MSRKEFTNMSKKSVIHVQNTNITILQLEDGDYVSMSDLVRNFDGGASLIERWLRNKNTIEFLGTWEMINNPNFNSSEFEGIKDKAGTNRFHLSVKSWVETGAIGVHARAGRHGGTFAQQDIAFEFCSWLSPQFKLYLIKEFQRFKIEESRRLSAEWNVRRTFAKINYHIHTDAIKKHMIPQAVSKRQVAITYAAEADVLNVALFGQTSVQWCKKYPYKKGEVK